MNSKYPREIVILLTATIDPGNTVMVARRDPGARMQDYCLALRDCWLSEKEVSRLVFCENSGYDISAIHELCAGAKRDSLSIEILSFDGQHFPAHLGKGFGEMGIISHVLRNSAFLQKGNPMIVKATGRLMVKNIGILLREIQERSELDIACDFRENLRRADSRVFVASAKFLREYFIPLQVLANDSAGVTFERLLGMAAHRAISDGLNWVPMPFTADWRGIEGTNDKALVHSIPKWLARDMFRRLKNWMIAR